MQSELILLHKKKFSIKDFFSNCDQIRRKLWIWSHLLKKSFIKKFHFLCNVYIRQNGYQLESRRIIKKVLGLLKILVTWLLLIFPDAFLRIPQNVLE